MNIEQYVQKFSPKTAAGGTELHFNCPFCPDSRERFYIRTKTIVLGGKEKRRGSCYCQNCQYKGSFLFFFAQMESISSEEAFQKLQAGEYATFKPKGFIRFLEEMGLKKKTPGVTNAIRKVLDISTRFPPVPFPKSPAYRDSVYGRMAYKYLRNRNLYEKEIRAHDIRYCSTAGKYMGYLILPITEKGKIVYFTTRRFIGKGLKTLNPLADVEVDLGKSDVVFNLEKARKHKFAVVTEGPFDAMAVGDQGISLLGKSMSETQRQKIIEAKFDHVYVMLDSEYDATMASFEIAEQLGLRMDTTVVPIDMFPGHDPGSLGREKIWEIILNVFPMRPIDRTISRLSRVRPDESKSRMGVRGLDKTPRPNWPDWSRIGRIQPIT